ncbi:MAG: type pilus assembly protein PilB [Actinomycetota bacterium]|nr:type pilus assembly protein PilB [Actinomycetota bacterium]
MAKANARTARARTRTDKTDAPKSRPSAAHDDSELPSLAEIAAAMIADAEKNGASDIDTAAQAVSDGERSDDSRHGGSDDAPWTRKIARGSQFGRVGQTMIDRGLVTMDQLDAALALQRATGKRVGDALVEIGALSRFDLTRVLADHLGVPFVDLQSKQPDPLLTSVLPEEVARRYSALPITRWNDQLVIAMANPNDLFALDDLHLVTRSPIIAAMADEEHLAAAIDRAYQVSTLETTLDAASSDYETVELSSISSIDDAEAGPVIALVNALLEQAIADGASDLHVEPNADNIAIRVRIDGVLHDMSEIPLGVLRPLVSRLKILGDLDIAQNRVAQDGRFSLKIHGRPIDVRVVSVPTAAGESVVLRLLDPVREALDVASLGLTPTEEARFLPAFRAPQGAVFITGPTGSGKTSTVYAVLSQINDRAKSIVTVEDPVEYRLHGTKQIQVNPRAGVDFPNALRSILRADPDIVLIGEVRDAETARIAADASITGHLVLSTLHTTRAAAAPMRLIDMGVEPYLVSSALTLVAAQRLARKLCENCAEPFENPDFDLLRDLGADDSILEGATINRAVGCAHCRNTGYRGRIPLFEIMPISEGISRLIVNHATSADIEMLATAEGMENMRVASLRRVARGILSIDEMIRVIA